MSHWMTSGGARLKARQKNSFAQRATKRAEVLVPSDPILNKGTSNNGFRGKLWMKKVKQRYTDKNPITRRGIEARVSYRTIDKENCPPLNNAGIVSSEKLMSSHSLPVTSRRRIRDSNSIYTSQRRTENQRAGSTFPFSKHAASDIPQTSRFHDRSDRSIRQDANCQNKQICHGVYHDRIRRSPSRFSSQTISSRQYAASDISHATHTYHPPDHSFLEHDPPLQRNSTNDRVWNDSAQETPSRTFRQTISRRQYDTSDASHTTYTPHVEYQSFQQESYFQNSPKSEEVYNDGMQETQTRFSRQAISKKQYATSDISYKTYTRHPSGASFQRDSRSHVSRFQNHFTTDEVYTKRNQKIPPRFFTQRVTQSSVDRRSLSSNHGEIRQSSKGSVYHGNVSVMRNTGLRHRQLSDSYHSYQMGIKRFQKHNLRHPTSSARDDEDNKLGPSFRMSDGSWGNSNSKSRDSSLERKRRHYDYFQSDAYSQIEPNRYGQAPQICLEKDSSENNSVREFKKARRIHIPSTSSGIKRFKQKSRGNTSSKPDQQLQIRRSPSNETSFEHPTLSDRARPFSQISTCQQGEGDQLDHSTPSIKFFDNQDEIDMWGKPLNSSKARSPYRKQYSDRLGTRYAENRDDDFGQASTSVASHFEQRALVQTPHTENRDNNFVPRRLSIVSKNPYTESSKRNFRQGRQNIPRESWQRSLNRSMHAGNCDTIFRQSEESISRQSEQRSLRRSIEHRQSNCREERQSIPSQYRQTRYHQTPYTENSDDNFRQITQSIPTRSSGQRSFGHSRSMENRRNTFGQTDFDDIEW